MLCEDAELDTKGKQNTYTLQAKIIEYRERVRNFVIEFSKTPWSGDSTETSCKSFSDPFILVGKVSKEGKSSSKRDCSFAKTSA